MIFRRIVLVKLFSLVILICVGIVSFPREGLTLSAARVSQVDVDFDTLTTEQRYTRVLSRWKLEGLTPLASGQTTYHAEMFDRGTNQLLGIENSYDYDRPVIDFSQGSVTLDLFVETEGLYEIALDYRSTTENILPIMLSLTINDEIPFNEARQVPLDTFWHTKVDENLLDRYGNEILPRQTQNYTWHNIALRDASRFIEQPLLFHFSAGNNTLTLSLDSGSLLLGDITIQAPKTHMSYESYLVSNGTAPTPSTLQTYEAQNLFMKNAPAIRPGTSRDVGLTPQSVNKLRVNILDGITYNLSGETVYYQINVETSGYYYLTFKAKQDLFANAPSFRRLTINGVVPFQEAERLAFPYSTRWENVTLPYQFYLEEGTHLIGLEANAGPYTEIYETLQDILLDISFLTLDIKQLTGNNADRNRDWDLERFIPGVTEQLEGWRSEFVDMIKDLKEINDSRRDSRDIVFLESAIKNLDRLLKDVDRLPYRLNILSEGSGSVSQLLGDAINIMMEQPLSLDVFYVHGDVSLPRSEPNIFIRLWIGIQRFFLSFFDNPYNETVETGELSIWVNRNRQMVDIMQELADSRFTPETGIRVKFSLMPDESKLIMANAAGVGPDIAMGTHVNLAYNLALRDTVYDLTQFDDFFTFIEMYEHFEALVPFVHDEGIYGLPETQNFNIMFYRKDLFDMLNLTLPETWDDVITLLPELQRLGMNFFVPLAYADSYKTTDTTVPFIYQFGGSLYHETGIKTIIDEPTSLEAIRFMSQLFTIYGLPLQVPSFYHQFRYGVLPIGIGDFGVYVQLSHAAPEIKNMWGIVPIPGVLQEDGSINRSATGVGHGMMILDNSQLKDEAWSFMKWWMGTDVQVEFEQDLTMTLGSEYMWNSANLEAFRLASWPEADKAVLLEQWQSLRNVPNTPAGYMLERELSNIWNKIVMSNERVRDAVDDSVLLIDREMVRKNFEFGYTDRFGVMIKPYPIPTGEWIYKQVNFDE